MSRFWSRLESWAYDLSGLGPSPFVVPIGVSITAWGPVIDRRNASSAMPLSLRVCVGADPGSTSFATSPYTLILRDGASEAITRTAFTFSLSEGSTSRGIASSSSVTLNFLINGRSGGTIAATADSSLAIETEILGKTRKKT